MAQQQQFGMFGPSNDPWAETFANIDRQAGMDTMQTIGSLAGRGTAQLMGGFGFKPAAVQRQEQINEAMKAARDPGGDMLTTYKNLAHELHSRGLVEEAMKAEQMYSDAQQKKIKSESEQESLLATKEERLAKAARAKAETEAKELETASIPYKAQYLMTKDPTMDRNVAEAIARDSKTFAELVKNPKRKTKTETFDGQRVLIYEDTGETIKVLGKAGKTLGETLGEGLLKLQEKGQEEIGRLTGRELERYQAGERALDALKEASSKVEGGIYTGPYGSMMEKLAKYSRGVVGSKKRVYNTEAFRSYIGQTVIPKMKELGGNDSNEELRKMEQIMGANTELEEETIKDILRGAELAIRRDRERIIERSKKVLGGKSPYPTEAEQGGSSPAKTVDWSKL